MPSQKIYKYKVAFYRKIIQTKVPILLYSLKFTLQSYITFFKEQVTHRYRLKDFPDRKRILITISKERKHLPFSLEIEREPWDRLSSHHWKPCLAADV